MLSVVLWKAQATPQGLKEWAKTWNEERFRELGLDAANAWSDTDKDEDSGEDNAIFPDEDISLEDCSDSEEDNTSAADEVQ